MSMKRASWQAFAGALRGFLILAVVIAVPATVLVLTSPTASTEEVVTSWKNPATPPAELFSLGNVAILGFLIIPFMAYGASLSRFGPDRQWPYVVMALLQLGIFITVAIGVV
ncbi:MAG TPA: hypothetical protein VJ932_07985 [Alkalispirochaeta sp.]|nr:hypothetical protein [Alkalispirochaeta sp.]